MQLGREGHWCECGLFKGPLIPGLRERLACYGWGKGREVKADEVLSQDGNSREASRGASESCGGGLCISILPYMVAL